MALLSTLALPANIARGDGSGYTRFITDIDAVFRCNQVNDGSLSYTTAADQTGVNANWNGKLWRLEVTRRWTDETGFHTETVYVGPENATQSEAYQTTLNGNPAFVFDFRGIEIPGAPDDSLWVRIACVAPAGDAWHDWYGWCGHERGENSRIEVFEYPFFVVPSHATPKGGETGLEGTFRTRMLLPNNFHLITPQYCNNFNVGFAAQVTGPTYPSDFRGNEVFHPGSFWFLGFVTLCACNDTDAATYLRCLHLQVRDDAGWLKQLRWACEASASQAYTQLAPGHRVGYEMAFAQGPIEQGFDQMLMPAAGFRNSYGPRWVLEVHAFTAENEAWWYDAASRYRDTYQATALPPRLITNPDIGPYRKQPGILLATIHAEPGDDAPWMDDVVTLADLLKRQLTSTEVPITNANSLVHFQTWAKGYGDDVNMARLDFSDELPEIADTITALKSLGYRVSLYTRVNDDHRGQFFNAVGRAAAPFIREDGTPGVSRVVFPLLGIDRVNVKFRKSHPSFPTAAIYALIQGLIFRHRCGAVYFDSYAGGNEIEGEPPGGMSTRYVVGNGGRYYTDFKRLMATVSRSILQASSDFPGAAPDAGFIVFSEVAEERMLWDWHGRHYAYHEMHLEQADDQSLNALLFGSVPVQATDYPIQCRDLQPPLWQCVHNKWSPTGAFTNGIDLTDLETCDLQVATGQGLTAAQWLDNKCLPIALAVVQGVHQIMVSQFMDNLRLPAAISAGNQVVANTAHDPTGAGLVLLEFIRQLLRGMSADTGFDFLVDGTMMRPLEVDFASLLVASTPNPAQHYQNVRFFGGATGTDWLGKSVNSNWFVYNGLPQPLGYGNQNFPVVNVLHTVWEADDGTIGIVLINWTGADAAWEGTVVPARYGLAGTVNVSVRQNGGAPISLGSSAAASFTLRSSAAVGGDIHLGFLPPRSITVLELT